MQEQTAGLEALRLATSRAMFGSKTPPPGWTIASGRLEEVATVTGYAQRGCRVRGRCYSSDCRRNVYLDWLELTKHGQALLTVREVRRTYSCGRIGGCAIDWIEEPSRRVTLGDLAGREFIAIEVACLGVCQTVHVTTVGAVISRLEAAKTGGRDTQVTEIAAAIPGPCPKCHSKAWRAEVLWFDPDSRRVPIWRQDLMRRLDRARARKGSEPMKLPALPDPEVQFPRAD